MPDNAQKDRKPNRLIHEKSPYLLQHAYNPVDWHSWSDEAFAKAIQEDKPIFLSIGYSTCHWCHVMERESFENEEAAELLNGSFVSIKVDREERPDIDAIYMDVCQAITGHGGWPLTIVMTPDKKPFFAATYLPKSGRGSMAGLMEILPEISKLWANQRETVIESGEHINSWIRKTDIESSELNEDVFADAYQYHQRTFDSQYGGFGSAPKFPAPHHLYFLLRYHIMTGEEEALDMVEKTLQSMYQGGLYDHIGFGFTRYSTDHKWLVPHFEKMLYDNALLAIAYLEAYQITGNSLYAKIATEVFIYVKRDMTSPEGGFYSAEDADSEGVEGKFYVWTPDEVKNILGDLDGEYFCRLYNITQHGNFEGHSIPNFIEGRLYPDEEKRAEKMRQQLFAAREQRVHPHKDDKILTSWNGMMIAALAYGSRVLNNPALLTDACRAADFILTRLRREDGRLLARYRDGEAAYPGYAADYACLIWGLIEIYQAGFNSGYLEAALELTEDLIKFFGDDENGGFYFYGSDAEQLITRPKESYDGAVPADNSVACACLTRLARITGDNRWEETAARTLSAFGESINQMPAAHTFFLVAALLQKEAGREVVITGRREDEKCQEMLKAVNRLFLPFTQVVFREEDDRAVTALIPMLADMPMRENKTTAYVCENFSCQRPTTSVEEFTAHLLQ